MVALPGLRATSRMSLVSLVPGPPIQLIVLLTCFETQMVTRGKNVHLEQIFCILDALVFGFLDNLFSVFYP